MAAEDIGAGSLVDVAYDHILNSILTRKLVGGDVVQEARISSQIGLSRTPVREALGRLEGENLLVRNGRLVLVPTVTIKDALEVLHLRRLIECEAVALACGAIALRRLYELRSSVIEMTSGVTADEHWAIDDSIHETIAAGSGSDLLLKTVKSLRRRTRLFNLKRVPARFEPGRREHIAIIDALIAEDREGARQAMSVHFDNVREGILGAIGHL